MPLQRASHSAAMLMAGLSFLMNDANPDEDLLVNLAKDPFRALAPAC